MVKFSHSHIQFYVKRRRNFDICQVKLTPNINAHNYDYLIQHKFLKFRIISYLYWKISVSLQLAIGGPSVRHLKHILNKMLELLAAVLFLRYE